MSFRVSGNNKQFQSQKTASVDVDATSVTAALDISGQSDVFLEVVGVTGTHATHVVTMQTSSDGTVWNDTAVTITGEGIVQTTVVTARFVRSKVTTDEGSAATANITIQAKG